VSSILSFQRCDKHPFQNELFSVPDNAFVKENVNLFLGEPSETPGFGGFFACKKPQKTVVVIIIHAFVFFES
jgi:hypothetical protein